MTDNEIPTIDEILDAFAPLGEVLPAEAMRQALERWDDVAPHLLTYLEAYADGTDRSDRAADIAFIGVMLMAQRRDTRAYRPLCRIAADDELSDELLGDVTTEHLGGMLVRVFDGDPAPLRALIESPHDEPGFGRGAGLEALAWLTATGRLPRDETAGYLQAIFDTLQPRKPGAESYVWVAWVEAIARLGLADLKPLVAEAFQREFVSDTFMEFSDFESDLEAARNASDPRGVFDSFPKDEDILDDVIAKMATWACFLPSGTPEPRTEPAPSRWDDVWPDEEPEAVLRPSWVKDANQTAHNPYRNVGRNDRCPCGSGKKFKKCCLDKVA